MEGGRSNAGGKEEGCVARQPEPIDRVCACLSWLANLLARKRSLVITPQRSSQRGVVEKSIFAHSLAAKNAGEWLGSATAFWFGRRTLKF